MWPSQCNTVFIYKVHKWSIITLISSMSNCGIHQSFSGTFNNDINSSMRLSSSCHYFLIWLLIWWEHEQVWTFFWTNIYLNKEILSLVWINNDGTSQYIFPWQLSRCNSINQSSCLRFMTHHLIVSFLRYADELHHVLFDINDAEVNIDPLE